MLSGMKPPGNRMESSGRSLLGRLKSTRRLRGRKAKGKRSKSKGKSKGKGAPRSITSTRSCMTNDFLFAMMSTKSKPTWRDSTWNGADYMICTSKEVASLQARQVVIASRLVRGVGATEAFLERM